LTLLEHATVSGYGRWTAYVADIIVGIVAKGKPNPASTNEIHPEQKPKNRAND
jgi:hypothetical protein